MTSSSKSLRKSGASQMSVSFLNASRSRIVNARAAWSKIPCCVVFGEKQVWRRDGCRLRMKPSGIGMEEFDMSNALIITSPPAATRNASGSDCAPLTVTAGITRACKDVRSTQTGSVLSRFLDTRGIFLLHVLEQRGLGSPRRNLKILVVEKNGISAKRCLPSAHICAHCFHRRIDFVARFKLSKVTSEIVV
jgi:hypothetical protein